MKNLVTIIVLSALGMSVSAQKFIDNSPDTTIVFSGQHLGKQWCKVAAHNNDARSVVALVVDFQSGKIVATTMHDHFFQTDEYIQMHGKDIDIHFQCAENTDVLSTIRFIQFSDGSVWSQSDPVAVAKIKTTRQEATDYLNSVILSAKLGDDPGPTRNTNGEKSITQSEIWWVLKQEKDPIASAQLRIDNANYHSNWLSQLPH